MLALAQQLLQMVLANPTEAGGLLLVALSVVNGFMSHQPVSAGSVLHQVIDLLSVTARRDSPATFKLPFTASPAPTPAPGQRIDPTTPAS